MANPAGAFNPTGGLLASRKFGGQNQKSKVFQIGKQQQNLIDREEDEDETYDDNLSTGDVIVIGGGASEYSRDQSFLSIKQYESSDNGSPSNILRTDSDAASSSQYTTNIVLQRASSSIWDDSNSQYTDSNIIVVGGDGASSY